VRCDASSPASSPEFGFSALRQYAQRDNELLGDCRGDYGVNKFEWVQGSTQETVCGTRTIHSASPPVFDSVSLLIDHVHLQVHTFAQIEV
jgi:hypothetical protein